MTREWIGGGAFRRLLPLLAIPLAALAVVLTMKAGGAGAPALPAPTDSAPLPRDTTGRIAALQAAVRGGDTDPRTFSALGDAFLQRVRETGDPALYERAERAYGRALSGAPRSVDALTGMGTLSLARHDFAGGLRYGLAARRAAPQTLKPYPVLVDALIELGRYPEAFRTLQQFVDLKPTLASYARVSYARELQGDLPGALEALRLAAAAGGEAAENVAYVQTLIGNLSLSRNRPGEARDAYRLALRRVPGYVPASAGLARADVALGDLPAAITRLRSVVARLPLPEYVVALGDAELAAGRPAAARRDLALVRAQGRLLASAGVNTDVDLALFEADHGSPAKGVTLARRGYAAAPSVRSADALGWSLARAGRPGEALAWMREALRLGWRDPLVLYHAGMTAKAAGQPALARTWLSRALRENPRFNAVDAPRARDALQGLR